MFSTRRLPNEQAQIVLATSSGKLSGSLAAAADRPIRISDCTEPGRLTSRRRRADAAGEGGVAAGASPVAFQGPKKRVTVAETAAASTSPTTTSSALSGRNRRACSFFKTAGVAAERVSFEGAVTW